MASIPANMFTCSDSYCIDANTVIHHDLGKTEGNNLGIPISMDVKCYYLIRSGFELAPGVTEQDVIDRLEEQGQEAMWVDSESDALAMAMEMAR